MVLCDLWRETKIYGRHRRPEPDVGWLGKIHMKNNKNAIPFLPPKNRDEFVWIRRSVGMCRNQCIGRLKVYRQTRRSHTRDKLSCNNTHRHTRGAHANANTNTILSPVHLLTYRAFSVLPALVILSVNRFTVPGASGSSTLPRLECACAKIRTTGHRRILQIQHFNDTRCNSERRNAVIR